MSGVYIPSTYAPKYSKELGRSTIMFGIYLSADYAPSWKPYQLQRKLVVVMFGRMFRIGLPIYFYDDISNIPF